MKINLSHEGFIIGTPQNEFGFFSQTAFFVVLLREEDLIHFHSRSHYDDDNFSRIIISMFVKKWNLLNVLIRSFYKVFIEKIHQWYLGLVVVFRLILLMKRFNSLLWNLICYWKSNKLLIFLMLNDFFALWKV